MGQYFFINDVKIVKKFKNKSNRNSMRVFNYFCFYLNSVSPYVTSDLCV